MKRGKDLDDAIERELQLMLVDGFEKSPISHKLLHTRLVDKGVINGGLSTLSTPNRKHLIAHYIDNQLSPLRLEPKEKQLYVNKKTRSALMNKNIQLQDEIKNLKEQLSQNTVSLINIVKAVSINTTIPVERLLAAHVIRELRDK